jgi:hypothetical protein
MSPALPRGCRRFALVRGWNNGVFKWGESGSFHFSLIHRQNAISISKEKISPRL